MNMGRQKLIHAYKSVKWNNLFGEEFRNMFENIHTI